MSKKDYESMTNAWNHFKCKDMKEFLTTYLTADVLLLGDIFENFRKKSYSDFQLDPIHYVSNPGLVGSAVLNRTVIHVQN